MHVQITGQHLEITEALRAYVHARLERLTKMDERLVNLTVVMSVDKLEQKAEGTLNCAGATLHAEAIDADMYNSIDQLFDRLAAQLRKHREKVADKHQYEARQFRQAV